MGFSLHLSRRFRAFRAPQFFMRKHRSFADRSGSAAVEFAIVGPILLILMTGIFTYGGYFLTAHTVQQLANDAARASIAGLDDEERLALAREAMMSGISSQRFMRGDLSRITVTRAGLAINVAVTYDASEDVYWAFQTLVPAPPTTISRTSTIRAGGF